MDLINRLEFDVHCQKTAALIGIFAAVRILTSMCGDGLPFAARCFGALVGELSACIMISLYFCILTHAFSSAAPEKSSRSVAVCGALSAALKLYFVLDPLTPHDENALFVKFAALFIDAFLSRLYTTTALTLSETSQP